MSCQLFYLPYIEHFSGLYIIFYLIVTSAFAGVTVPYNALIADKSHPSQRGRNNSIIIYNSFSIFSPKKYLT